MRDADPDAFDTPTTPPRRHRRPKAAGRLAVRAHVQRLAWVDDPLIYWTGQPDTTAELGPAAAALQSRLASLPAGPYAVRLDVPAAPPGFATFARFLKELTPTVL